MPTVREIYEYINSFAPYETQEPWDNSGLLLGDPDRQVCVAAVALDATMQTVAAAKEIGAQLLLTHHPVIFSPMKKITAGSPVYELLTNGISAVSTHTCWDSAQGGVNDVLAEKLGLKNVKPLESAETKIPMMRIGEVEPMSGEELAELVKEKLGCHPRLADAGKTIATVAVCGGSASSLVYETIGKADAFITGDLSHHVFIDAVQGGMTVIAAGHFETEAPSMLPFAKLLRKKFPSVRFEAVSQDNPVKYF